MHVRRALPLCYKAPIIAVTHGGIYIAMRLQLYVR